MIIKFNPSAAHCHTHCKTAKNNHPGLSLNIVHFRDTVDVVDGVNVFDIKIIEQQCHPNYINNEKLALNDIMLLRLQKEVDFSSYYIKPICLPVLSSFLDKDFQGHSLTVAGWGINETRRD